MERLSEFKPPEVYTPKKVDNNGLDADGVLHDKCGTDDCCNKCETADTLTKDQLWHSLVLLKFHMMLQ